MRFIPPRMRNVAGMATGVSLLAMSSAWAADVTVWCWAPEFNGAAMNEAIARYTAMHPGDTITVVDFAKGDLETKLQTQLASGTTEGLPDIVLIEGHLDF